MTIIIALATIISLGVSAYFLFVHGRRKCIKCGKMKKMSTQKICPDCILVIRRKEAGRITNVKRLVSEIDGTDAVSIIIPKTMKLIESLRYFMKYEKMGVHFFDKSVEELNSIYIMKKDEMILRSIKQKVKIAMDASDRREKPYIVLGFMNDAILQITEIKRFLNYGKDSVDPLEQSLKNSIVKTQVKIYFENAEAYETQGFPEKALVQYSRILMYIRQNDKEHIMKKELKLIEKKLIRKTG